MIMMMMVMATKRGGGGRKGELNEETHRPRNETVYVTNLWTSWNRPEEIRKRFPFYDDNVHCSPGKKSN